MTSTSSSSSDRITACAPVSCSGATCFGRAVGGLAAGFAASEAMRATSCDAGVDAGACGSECGLVGGSPVPLRRCSLWKVVGDLFADLTSMVGNKKPPSAQQLHEGCAW